MTDSTPRNAETPSTYTVAQIGGEGGYLSTEPGDTVLGRKTFQPYAHVIELLDAACALLKEHVESAETPDDERTRLRGSMDSIRFERNIVSGFEAAKVVYGNRKRL